jgi:predicted metalloprotease
VRFRKGARLDPGQVRDVRGRRVGGAGGLAVGGGGIGIAILVIYLLVSALSGGGGGLPGQLGPLDNQRVGEDSTPSEVSQECKTGEDANQREDCRIVAVVNSVQKFWDEVFTQSNQQYQPPTPSSPTRWTRAAERQLQVGPFYCPADKLVYIDLGFFDELSQFGAKDTTFVEAYVLATSTATTSRISSVCSIGSGATRRGRRAPPSARSCRPTATGESGRRTRPRPASSSA